MSRAFVKDGERTDGEALAELRVSPHRNLVTPEGLAKIEATVERLRAELTAARAADDRAGVNRIQRDLRYWSERRRTAEPVAPTPPGGKVRFGCVVVLAGRDRVFEYRIVGEDEAEPADGRISYVSPIARLLIGREPGDELDLPDGPVKIVEIR